MIVSQEHKTKLEEAMNATTKMTEDQAMELVKARYERAKAIMDSIKTSSDLKGPKRLEDESFDDYKFRRDIEAVWTKNRKRGNMVWIATAQTMDKASGVWYNVGGGTYTKATHGELGINRVIE